jgi:hypothetical protein
MEDLSKIDNGTIKIYEDQISDRLNNFLVNHSNYEDIGDTESGPELTAHYAGPQWAIDLANCALDWADYQFMVAYANFMEDEQ